MTSDNKSVLFLLGAWDIGGVERVTAVISKELLRRGWRVSIAAFKIGDRSLLHTLPKDIESIELAGDGMWFSRDAIKKFANFVLLRDAQLIVNQWCVPYKVTRFIRKATRPQHLPLIAFHHNRPDTNNRIIGTRNILLRTLFKMASSINARLVYEESDEYVVLSPSFMPLMKRFVHKKNMTHLSAIPNPLTISPINCVEKENVILYVGRLEETQKKISRVIETWRKLYMTFPDWRLVIVGDGPDRGRYEAMADGVDRIEFVGFTNPAEWYSKARVLLLTSDFEGFGLVIVEAMAFGCVPIVLGSYPAVYDIVNEGCGRIVPIPYDTSKFAVEVQKLMEDVQLTARMSNNAKVWAKTFSLEAVVNKYEALFERVLRSKTNR